VIIEHRHGKHAEEAGENPDHLHAVKADKLGVQRGAVNFKDAENAHQHHHAEQRPVKVTEAEEAANHNGL